MSVQSPGHILRSPWSSCRGRIGAQTPNAAALPAFSGRYALFQKESHRRIPSPRVDSSPPLYFHLNVATCLLVRNPLRFPKPPPWLPGPLRGLFSRNGPIQQFLSRPSPLRDSLLLVQQYFPLSPLSPRSELRFARRLYRSPFKDHTQTRHQSNPRGREGVS